MLRSARQIINNEADANWYQAEKNGQTGFIPANYVEMAPHEYAARIHAPMRIRTLMQSHMQACKHTHTHQSHSALLQHTLLASSRWFHGQIKRVTAEQTLLNCPTEGAFLFRESESTPGGFSLSVR